ncbi:Aminotransferase-like, plant mobile domain [Sesbania bispinosa]|nr:Aminotransferase-like, plant mobile domain [Sesbania bispinosa]
MVKTHPARADPPSEDSSSSADSSTDLIPRSITSVAWTHLPPPRTDPLDATSRTWMTDHQPAIRPFCSPPSSGDDFFKDSLVAPSVNRQEALLFHEVANTPTHTVGSSLLRSRLIRGEIPWVPCTFVARATVTGCWAEWVEHTFANDPPFVDIMKRVGIADAVKFTPTLEDVHILLKLPLFGDFDITTSFIDSHIIDRAKELKGATIDSAKYSREFLARLRAEAPEVSSKPKSPARWVKGSGNVLPPDKRKVARESVKYTFATWVRYFFGDTDKGTFYPGPSLPQPLKRAAFLAFWLSKYVFPGPPWESVSPSLFIMACLLAEGVRLPLASFFLGGFYGRLDQIQDQLFISFGSFPISSFVDMVFLQYILFEDFPEYALVRMIPESSANDEGSPLEPRIWSWTMGRPRHSLLDLLDEEDQFIHRPYVASFFPGIKGLHRIYKEDEFITRNIRSSRSEGVFDIWLLILRPQMLPGFIITDTVSAAGGAYWPYAYRPDRVCRQFGLDQPPCCINMEFVPVSESVKAVLFKPSSSLPSYDAGRFVNPERVGRVLDLWIAYYARLKNFVKRYESQDSMQHFTNVQIMCKDPYYSTTAFKTLDAKGNCSVLLSPAPPAHVIGKKRKPAPPAKGKKGVTSSCEIVPPQPKKATRSCKSALDRTSPPMAKKPPSTRSAKVKKKLLLPTRASERLKAKTKTNCFPPSSPIMLQASDSVEDTQGDEVTQDSLSSSKTKSASFKSGEELAASFDKGEGQAVSEHASTPSNDVVATQPRLEAQAQSITSPALDVPETPDPTMIPHTEAVSSQALIVVPLSTLAPTDVHPSLSSLLSNKDALLLTEFASSHNDFLLAESAFPAAFMKLAYSFFTNFLRFMRSNPFMDLLSVKRDKVVEDLKTLCCFGFKGKWLEDLFAQVDRSIPAMAFEDLQQALDAVRDQEQRNSTLRTQIDALSAELTNGETELIRLNAKCSEIKDARVGFDADFHI